MAFRTAERGAPAHTSAVPAYLPFSEPWIGDEEIEACVQCLRSGWLTSGPKVVEFERDFAGYVGAPHALAVNSCTSALHLALEAVGVGPGDEVITSPMTFAATAAVIEHLGARPVLVDVESDTLNMDAEALEPAITPRTRAILPVHFGGQPCDMDLILGLARAHDLAVVEDAAHALPASYKGRRVGTLGDVTCFSFYVTKTITTGEGGMAVTDRDDLAERMRIMRLHGMSKDAWKRYTKEGSWFYEITAPGFKYNLPDLAAAIGIPQLKRCDEFLARREAIARAFDEALGNLPGVSIPAVKPERGHAWHLYVVQVDPNVAGIDRDLLIRRLAECGIGTSVHFIPLHLHPYYRDKYGYRPDDFPRAHAAFRRIVSLPLFPRMTDGDVARVTDAVRDILEASRP
jgi:perosamine synthetase